jgi:predicted deacylase
VDGSLNVLGHLGMIKRTVKPLARPVWLAGAGQRIAAKEDGVFFAAVPRNTMVKPGQVIGRTTDLIGRPTGEITAPVAGLVTFIRGVPSMARGATLVNIAPVLDKPAPWKLPGR